jgi:hypothetical protein
LAKKQAGIDVVAPVLYQHGMTSAVPGLTTTRSRGVAVAVRGMRMR